jgi:hypothetical protein
MMFWAQREVADSAQTTVTRQRSCSQSNRYAGTLVNVEHHFFFFSSSRPMAQSLID